MKNRIITLLIAVLVVLVVIPPVSAQAEGTLFYDPNSGLAINITEAFEFADDGMTSDEDEIVWLYIGNPCHLAFFDWGYLYDIYKGDKYKYSDEKILEIFVKYFVSDLFEGVFGKPVVKEGYELYPDFHQIGAEYNDRDGSLISYASGVIDRFAVDTVWRIYGELTSDKNGGIFFSVAVFPKYAAIYDSDLNSVMYSVRYAASKGTIPPYEGYEPKSVEPNYEELSKAEEARKNKLKLSVNKLADGRMAFVFTYTHGPQSELEFDLYNPYNSKWLYGYTSDALSKTEGTLTVYWDYKMDDGTYAKSGDMLLIWYYTDEVGLIKDYITLP